MNATMPQVELSLCSLYVKCITWSSILLATQLVAAYTFVSTCLGIRSYSSVLS